MKPIALSAHAERRIRERDLSMSWVEAAVRAPLWVETDSKDAMVQRRFRPISQFGGRILRVACIETIGEIRIISAMFDRHARRKP